MGFIIEKFILETRDKEVGVGGLLYISKKIF